MGTNVSEDYRRGWVDCASAIRQGIREGSDLLAEEFGDLRQRVEDGLKDARDLRVKAGDDPHQLRGVADFYEVLLDLFLLRVEQERAFQAKRALRAFREKAPEFAS